MAQEMANFSDVELEAMQNDPSAWEKVTCKIISQTSVSYCEAHRPFSLRDGLIIR